MQSKVMHSESADIHPAYIFNLQKVGVDVCTGQQLDTKQTCHLNLTHANPQPNTHAHTHMPVHRNSQTVYICCSHLLFTLCSVSVRCHPINPCTMVLTAKAYSKWSNWTIIIHKSGFVFLFSNKYLPCVQFLSSLW